MDGELSFRFFGVGVRGPFVLQGTTLRGCGYKLPSASMAMSKLVAGGDEVGAGALSKSPSALMTKSKLLKCMHAPGTQPIS